MGENQFMINIKESLEVEEEKIQQNGNVKPRSSHKEENWGTVTLWYVDLGAELMNVSLMFL